MIANFVREIEHLLAIVPANVWADRSLCGLLYDFMPWNEYSGLSLQTRVDDEHDPASWRYFDCANSKCEHVRAEVKQYRQTHLQLGYHRLLIEAAEALLSIDLSAYGQPVTIDKGRLYGPFRLQVSDPDGAFRFNYCEYVIGRMLES